MKTEGRESAIENPSTKVALAKAMREMLGKTAFSRISISALCLHCGINRKSFYYHFRDKYDLLCWIFRSEFLETLPAENYGSDEDALLALCEYLDQNRAFYRKVMVIEGQNSFREYFENAMKMLLRLSFEQQKRADCDIAFFSEFMARALSSSIAEWLRDARGLSPAEFTRKIQMCVKTLRG